MDLDRIINTTYNILPEFYREKIEREASHAHIHNYRNLTVDIYAGFLSLLAIFLLIFQASATVKIATTVVGLPIIFALPYLIFSLMANKRRKQVEEVLPDALQLISANIQSGMTIDRAFLLSARDEFGPLAKDLKKAAMEMFGGKSVEDTLQQLSDDTNSELFEETLNLLQDGIESGGQVSKLLESSADDIQKSLHLREEIASNVKMYSLFISMAAMFGAPLLFSVSVFLTRTTGDMWSSESINFEDLPSTGPFEFSEPSFRTAFFADFSLVAIIISNFFAALIISEIKNGSVKEGFKYAPIFVIIAVVVFFATDTVITAAFGGLA